MLEDEIDLATLDIREITLDFQTVTLGEMAEAEAASGRDYQTLVTGRANQKMLALFLHVLRRSGRAPSWSALGNRRLSVASSSSSPSAPDGHPPRSSD